MNILSIGNSFSDDAHRYLHKVAKAEGERLTAVNLYIGGCSLFTHYRNMLENRCDYSFVFNGENTGINVSINQLLSSREWDVVTLQQASHFSYQPDTYTPYIEKLAEHVRLYAPKAKLLIHQTWAYEQGSARLSETAGFSDQKEMYNKIVDAYENAAKLISADGIIPCGKAMMQGVNAGYRMHRDTFHADSGYGRYLLALVWYKAIFGKAATAEFLDFDVEVDAETAVKMRQIAKEIEI